MLKIYVFLIFISANFCFGQTKNDILVEVYNGTQKINVSKPISLKYKKNNLTFKFKNNNDTLNNEFFYKLEGLEEDGTFCNCNAVNYSNLYGGEYTFWIKSTNKETKATSMNLYLVKNFWQEPIFILGIFFFVFIVIAIIIFGFLLYRFRQQTKLQRVRNDIASDLHDDIGATLSSISFFGEMMRSKILKNAPAEEVLVLLEKVISTSKETIETMRGVVWTINPNNDNAIDFFQKLQSFGKEMLAAKNIAFSFQTQGFEKEKLPLDIQRNLFLFYKESINNIAKHSKATQVEVSLKALPSGEGWVGLSDNGIGFNTNDLHEGHGLKSLRKRADELEGNLEIKSVEGQGTSITLSFPLP